MVAPPPTPPPPPPPVGRLVAPAFLSLSLGRFTREAGVCVGERGLFLAILKKFHFCEIDDKLMDPVLIRSWLLALWTIVPHRIGFFRSPRPLRGGQRRGKF